MTSLQHSNVGFVGPYGSANLGDYGILINDIYDLHCNHITVFSYNYNWPKVQLDAYCTEIQVDYCVVQVKENYFFDGAIYKYSEDAILNGCRNLDEVIRYVKAIDVLIISGGGWINSFWAYRTEKIAKIATIIYLAKSLNKPIRFMTQGLGPLGEFAEWYKSLFEGVNATVPVRDKQSLVVANRELKLSAKWCPDDLLIPNQRWDNFKSVLAPIETPYVLIEPFVPMENLKNNADMIGYFSRMFYEWYGCRLFYMPFDLVHFGNEQAQYCSSLSAYADYYDISSDLFPKFEDVLALINGADFVITGRYHGLVLALSCAIPVIHIVNDICGEYGANKAYSIVEWCFANGRGSLFCAGSLLDAFVKLETQYKTIRAEQIGLYNSVAYTNNITKAKAIRQSLLRDTIMSLLCANKSR